MSISQSLVAQLRRRIMDERVGRTAFRFSCVDEAATDCFVSISSAKVLTTNALNARSADNLSIDLTANAYKTIKLLVEYLNTRAGYQAVVEQEFEPNHPSDDLEVVGSMSIVGHAASLRHHLFSDSELLEVLDNACRRHNVSYTPETVPRNEEIFILMLAQAEVNRRLAGDAAKRRGIETSVDQLLAVARDLESAYTADTRRQMRAIPVPKFDEEATHTGDVVVGQFSRRSLRSGFFSPMAAEGLISAAKLDEPNPEDAEDTKILVHWRRNSDLRFYAYELWRDTSEVVERNVGAMNASEGQLLRDQVKRPTTSKIVFRSYGGNSNKDNIGFATFVEQAGQLITAFIDDGTVEPIEPDATYYYRLFIIGLNYEVVGSNTICVKTKGLRALLNKLAPIAPVQGNAGTLVTMNGTNFATGLGVSLGGKAAVPVTIIGPTQATFVIPTFNNPAAVEHLYDVVVTSANGLRDVLAKGFRYTGP